ncbi:hypothetical protein TIFTF001_004480 [Ficus carica]|uniref:Uncharacterized protein n=1 Tax=Ficus carica TaxID=3494 RepID=A0AA88CXY5_FICCA|nr:hypothetical protein TIFTF001_004480 [Ficus carica]
MISLRPSPSNRISTSILAWLTLATFDDPSLPSDDAPPPGDLRRCRPQPDRPQARSQTR